MPQRWRQNPAVVTAEATVSYAHFHRIIEVPVSEKNPTGTQKRISGTAATVEFPPSAMSPEGQNFVTSFALVSEGDNGSRMIGREFSRGRAVKHVASYIADENGFSIGKVTNHRFTFTHETKEEVESFIIECQKAPSIRDFLIEALVVNTPTEKSMNA